MRVLAVVALSCFVLGGWAGVAESQAVEAPLPAGVAAAIRRAGSSPDDAERLAILKEVLKRGDLPPAFRGELAPLVKTIGDYVRSTKITRYGRSKGFEHKIAEDSPLYPLVCFYRARTLIWHMIESGGIQMYPKRRQDYVSRATKLLEIAQKAFPDNPVIGMYLGRPIPPHKHYEAAPGVPEWAVWQREALERVADIIEWWVAHRQQPNGSYGGGLGDDCEMWRWWAPVLIGFQHPRVEQAQRKLSACILGQSSMRTSFSSRMSDVEHSAEPSADSITPMMHLAPDDPAWRQHTLNLVRLMKELWTGRNERGLLQFKSTYFSSEEVRLKSPKQCCDSVYHPRAIQPALLYWLRTGDKAVGELVTAWMDTWVDAAARAERGKPAGIIPSAIHWPDGKVGGLGTNWWEPENYGTKLYNWPSAMSMMTNSLLQACHMTGDRKYLEPVLSMARIRRKYLVPPPKPLAPGSEGWCALGMGRFLPGTLAKYRFLTGDKQFDDLLAKDASPYVRFRLQGDAAGLTAGLKTTVEALRVNWPGYTSEVRWTDRVIRFPGGWLAHAGHKLPTPNAGLLYSSATGDPGGVGYFPMNAVRWLTPPRDIAALVTDNSPRGLTARLFHFGEQKRPIAAELYLLESGSYRFELSVGGKAAASRTFQVSAPHTRIELTLPPRVPCALTVAPARAE